MTSPHIRAIAFAGLVFVTVIWGSTFVLVKWTVADIDVYWFLFLRFAIGAAAMGAVFWRRLHTTTIESLRASLILALFLFALYTSQTEGLRFTTASNGALITGLYLVIIPLISIIFLRRRLEKLHITGALIALAGLYFLTEYSISGFNFGDGLMLVSAVACSCHILMTDYATRRHALAPLVFFQFLFMALSYGVIAAARGAPTLQLTPVAVLTLAVTGILATAVAFTVQTAAQRIIDPTRIGIIFALEAVFGALFGYLIGGEAFTSLSLFGACLMVAGMVVAEMKPVAKYLIDTIVG